MGHAVFGCLLLCALMQLPHAFAEVAEHSLTSDNIGIAGTYLNLNISEAMPGIMWNSNVTKCPTNISIPIHPLRKIANNKYGFNSIGLSIASKNCTYMSDGSAVMIMNRTMEAYMKDAIQNYMEWNLTLPESTITCSSGKPEDWPSPEYITFVPVLFYYKILGRKELTTTKEETIAESDYMILLENMEETMDCLFFTEKHHSMAKQIMKEMGKRISSGSTFDGNHQDDDGDEDMKIGKGNSLKFCPVCSCQEKLGTDLDLGDVEMTEDDSTDVSADQKDKHRPWHPPRLFFKGSRCPIPFSKKYEDLMDEEEEEEEEESDDDKETKDLVIHAVINKLFDELKDELGEDSKQVGFRMKKQQVMMMMGWTFRKRGVLALKRGAKCHNKERPIEKDTVFLYEKKHILSQLANNRFVRKKAEIVRRILQNEDNKIHAFTLHVLRKKDDGSFSVCALSNSESSCDLLSSKEFCDNFEQLGSTASKATDDNDDTTNPLQPGQKPELPSEGDGTRPDTPSGDPNSTNSKPSDPPTTSQPGQTPTPPGQNPDGPGKSPGAGDGSSIAEPTEGASQTPGEVEKKSPTPTPTPVPASPSASASPSSNSSPSGLCFPAEAEVELEDGGLVRMDELKVGDSVRDGSSGFSKVILLTHSNRDVVTEFIVLRTKGGDIALSAQHYIPANDKLMTAETVKKGDMIYVLKHGRRVEAVVEEVERVWMRGLFNPQTVSGSVGVRLNGDMMVASTYTASVDMNVAHTLLTPLRMLSNFLDVVVGWSWILRDGSETVTTMLPSGAAVV